MDPRDTGTTTSSHPAPSSAKKKNSFGELVRLALIALLVVVPIRMFIAQPFIVSGTSMVPTFENAEYLIVDQVSYRFEEPVRGDVIVFKYPKDPSKYFIKRIIGLPGETVTVEGNKVTITNAEHPEGFELAEPYVGSMGHAATVSETLGEGEYFVMGDNRAASSDSRSWGVLEYDYIIGRAFLRLFPVTDVGIFPGHVSEFGS